MIDWEKERATYAGCSGQTFLLTAAVGLISKNVLKAYTDHLTSLYEIGETNPDRIFELMGQTRQLAARYLQAGGSEEVAFVPNASHGMNVIASLFKERHGVEGEILMPIDEFPTSVIPWRHHGFQVKQVKTHELLSHVGANTKAVLTSAVQFSTGYRADLVSIGHALAQRKIPFIVNATQALGAFATPVQEAKISALTGSCHKWFGAGFGAALLYLAKDFSAELRPPFAGWFSVENPFQFSNTTPTFVKTAAIHELGTLPFSTLAGIRASFENIERLGLSQISARIFTIAKYLEEGLRERGLEIVSERDIQPDFSHSINSGIISITSADADSAAKDLACKKIFVSARRGTLRISTHFYNNKVDVDQLLKHL